MHLSTEMSYLNQDNGIENVSIIIYKKKLHRHKKRKKTNFLEETLMGAPSLHFTLKKDGSHLSQHYSMPELKPKIKKLKVRSSDMIVNTVKHPYNSKYIVNVVSEYRVPECLNPFNNPLVQARWRVYRCQLSTAEESCCCSCNSDAMFEVMKSLYDCYKKKNCDHCNCILCGHLPREERKLGELRKSDIGVETKSLKKVRKEEMEQAAKELIGKTPAEKEKILKELVATGVSFPEPKSASEKELMKTVRTKMVSEAKTSSKKEKLKKNEAAEILRPLASKTASQKEITRHKKAEMGLTPPEGRTASKKVLKEKVKTVILKKPPSAKVSSEKIRQAKKEGILTPLDGKSSEQREKILKGLAMKGIPLPEGKSTSEKKIIDKVRTELGLPPAPKTVAEREKYQRAQDLGLLTPLLGKSHTEKEKKLKSLVELGIPLPEGRTTSEKSLIAKVKASVKAPSKVTLAGIPSEKIRKAKAAGLLTPIENKSREEKEKILKGLAAQGIPLPEGKTASDKKLIDKVRLDVGLPPTPKTQSEKKKYQKAQAAGLVVPLERKSTAEKEKILKELAAAGVPFPEPKSSSEKELMKKVRTKMGQPEAQKPSKKKKFKKGEVAGTVTPLASKTASQKEIIQHKQAEIGLTPPGGRTASKKALPGQVKTVILKKPPSAKVPSEKMRQAKEEGILTPLDGKSSVQREKILKGLAMKGIPLPEGKSSSEKKIIDKVRTELGLPPAPKTAASIGKIGAEVGTKTTKRGPPTPLSEKAKKLDAKTAKAIKESKGPSDECICGILTPESEKMTSGTKTPKMPYKIPSEKLKKAKEAGLLTPLEKKTPAQKEKIIKGLAAQGLPIPEGKTSSEKKLIDKVRTELGLPPAPKTVAEKEKHQKAQDLGLITPLLGKSLVEKEKKLKGLAELGIPLPEGTTASEKALIAKVKASAKAPSKVTLAGIPSEKIRKAKAAGLLTPIESKSPEEKVKILKGLAAHGIPLPEGKTASDKKLIDKVRLEVGLPPTPKSPSEKKKYQKAQAAGLVVPLERKSPAEKEKIMRGLYDLGIPLQKGRTESEEALIDKVKATSKVPLPSKATSAAAVTSKKLEKAKSAGLLTPLEGKTLKPQRDAGLPIPEGRTASEKALVQKTKAEYPEKRKPKALAVSKGPGRSALPPEQAKKLDKKTAKVMKEGKGPSDECICGLFTPESERASIRPPSKVTSEKLRLAKAAGLLTPIKGKNQEQKEKIIKGLAQQGLPLPEGKTASEKKFIAKMKTEMELPPKRSTTPVQKEKILKGLAKSQVALPEGRTASEKASVEKVKTIILKKPLSVKVPSEKMRQAKEEGLLTPLDGKSSEQREKILKGLGMKGIPLPEGKSPSEKKIIEKVRTDLGLPPAPKSAASIGKIRAEVGSKPTKRGPPSPLSEKAKKLDAKTSKAIKESKGPSDECICGILTPESEKITSGTKTPKTPYKIPSEKLKKAKEAGLLTPLEKKTPAQKEKIIKGLAAQGLPIPEGKTSSEKKLIDKVRTEIGLPPEPKTAAEKVKYDKALASGVIMPLEGKTVVEKEKTLKAQASMGIPLPDGRTPSEKALIAKVKAEAGALSVKSISSEKLRKAKAKGLLSPLQGKTPAQKEKNIKGLAAQGLPIPEGKTSSEKKLIEKVRTEIGLPPEPKTAAEKVKYDKALASGVIMPLEGKTVVEKEKTLKAQASMGIPLPDGRTPSEKALIAKVKAEAGALSVKSISSEKLRKAKAKGLLSPLQGKTHKQKEKILKGLTKAGLPLPEGKTQSEKAMIQKIATQFGEPEITPSSKVRTRSKKVGVGEVSKKVAAKEMGVGVAKTKAGIAEEYEDIVKTTTCERGCGCDKKKIRFKHSYVKIRVTSPDISSLCPCPNECLPGVKGGVFTDNEGIKVTVGSAIGVASFCIDKKNKTKDHNIPYVTDSCSSKESSEGKNSTPDVHFRKNINLIYKGNTLNSNSELSLSLNKSQSDDQSDDKIYAYMKNHLKKKSNLSINANNATRYLVTCSESCSLSHSSSLISVIISDTSSKSNFVVVKTESSLSFSSEHGESIGTISVISVCPSSIVSTSSHYIIYPKSESSYINVEDLEYFRNEIDKSSDSSASKNFEFMAEKDQALDEHFIDLTESRVHHQDIMVYRITQTSVAIDEEHKLSTKKYQNNDHKPFIVINDVNSDHSISKMIDEVMANDEFNNKSAIFVIVTTSDEYDSSLSESVSSTICIRLSENYARDSFKGEDFLSQKPWFPQGLKLTSKGKVKQYKRKHMKDQPRQEFNDTKLDSARECNNYQLSEQFAESINERAEDLNNHQIKRQIDEPIYKRTQQNDYWQMKRQFIEPLHERGQIEDNEPKMYDKNQNEASQLKRQKQLYNRTRKHKKFQSRAHFSDTILERKSENKHCQAELADVTTHQMFSMDTTQDRPCCCPTGGSGSLEYCSSYNNYNNHITDRANIASEIITPMIARQGAALGLNQEAYMGVSNGNKTGHSSAYTSSKLATRISRCNVVPVTSYQKQCHSADIQIVKNTPLGNKNNVMNTVGCGGKVGVNHGPEQSCGACMPDIDDCLTKRPCKCKGKEKLTCKCFGKGRKKEKLDCPCEAFQTPILPATSYGSEPEHVPASRFRHEDGYNIPAPGSRPARAYLPATRQVPAPGYTLPTDYAPTHPHAPGHVSASGYSAASSNAQGHDNVPISHILTKDFSGQCTICDEKKIKNKCACTTKRGRKKVICECPQEEEPPEEIFIEIDEKTAAHLRSDMTQTTSGFNFKFKKKPPVEEEMSFEEAVEYYERMYAEEQQRINDECTCDEKGKKRKKEVKCDCPDEPLPLEPPPPEPEDVLKGFKLSIGGKGSASTGLAGVCCFDRLSK